jgi:hypothetical protein
VARFVPKHPQASLWPSEVVTLGLLHALKGVGNRPFYRIFTWANFLHLIVNKSVKCDFLKEPSGYKPLIMEKSNT